MSVQFDWLFVLVLFGSHIMEIIQFKSFNCKYYFQLNTHYIALAWHYFENFVMQSTGIRIVSRFFLKSKINIPIDFNDDWVVQL